MQYVRTQLVHYHLEVDCHCSWLHHQKVLALLHRHPQIDQRYLYYRQHYVELLVAQQNGQMGFDRYYLVRKGCYLLIFFLIPIYGIQRKQELRQAIPKSNLGFHLFSLLELAPEWLAAQLMSVCHQLKHLLQQHLRQHQPHQLQPLNQRLDQISEAL